jgi:hypothetical protein
MTTHFTPVSVSPLVTQTHPEAQIVFKEFYIQNAPEGKEL